MCGFVHLRAAHILCILCALFIFVCLCFFRMTTYNMLLPMNGPIRKKPRGWIACKLVSRKTKREKMKLHGRLLLHQNKLRIPRNSRIPEKSQRFRPVKRPQQGGSKGNDQCRACFEWLLRMFWLLVRHGSKPQSTSSLPDKVARR